MKIKSTYILLVLLSCIMAPHLITAQQDSSKVKEKIEDIIITAQFQPTSISKSVFKVQIIDQQKIKAKAATNVQQLLNSESGISFSQDKALGTADINMYGMSGRNIKILIDGVPMLDRGDIRESLNQIPIHSIERIEIIEGPMSIIYGSDALVGVINIITKTNSHNKWNINAQIQEESVAQEYVPFNKKGLHTQNIGVDYSIKSLKLKANIFHYDFNGFGSDKDERNHSWKPKEQWIPSLQLQYNKNKFSIQYSADYLNEHILGKGAINYDNYKANTQEFITNRHTHKVLNKVNLSDRIIWSNSFSYINYKRNTSTTQTDYVNKTQQLTQGIGEQDTAKFYAANLISTLLINANSKLSIQPGAELNYETAAGARIEGNPVIQSAAAFLTLQYQPISKITFRPGLRYSINSIEKNTPLLASINALYQINEMLNLRASYARGYRTPALRELYFNFQDANHNLKGNPDLKSENAHSFNLGLSLRKKWGAFYWNQELSYNYSIFNNLISFGINPDNTQEYITLNIDKNKINAFNYSHKLMYNNWQLNANILCLGQYNELEQHDEFKDLPSFNWSPEISMDLYYYIPKTKTRLAIFYKYSGQKNNFIANYDEHDQLIAKQGYTQAYHYSDCSIQQQITKQLGITAGVKNIFNVTDLMNSTVNSGGVHGGGSSISFNYGRSYFLNISYQLHP